MKRYQAIIFDFDMTLADTGHVIVDMLNATAERFGYRPMPYERVIPAIGRPLRDLIAHVTGERDERLLDGMEEYYHERSRDEMPARTRFFPAIPDCLRAMWERNIRIGVLSLKMRKVMMISLEKYGLARYFSAVMGSEDIPLPKPDPSGLFAAMDAMGATAQTTLYVGDSLVDQETARGAGTDFAALLQGGTKREEFDPAVVTYYYADAAALLRDVEALPPAAGQHPPACTPA